MNRLRAIVQDERGIAVVLGLIALLTLTALVLAFLGVSAFEPQISRNLADGTKARYLAEAGLEEALDTLTNNINGDWNTYLTGATCTAGATGVVLGTANSALSGLTSASGTYTVRIRNDCQANDPMLTGVTTDANGTTEGNGHVILTSQGNFGSATRIVTVVATRVGNLFHTSSPYQVNAALSFPGYGSDTSFSGTNFTVDGRNNDINGNLTAGTNMLGISVGPETQFEPTGAPVMQHETQIQNAMTSTQKSDVFGKDQTNPSSTTTGNNTIAADTLTSAAVTDFVNIVKNYADITINSSSASPVWVSDIGSTCSSSPSSTTCWGTVAAPKIVYIKGVTDTTSLFNALRVSGTSTGAGILIVENGDFTITGNFDWKGPVIVTGGYVGVGLMGGGTQNITGGLISNETATNEAPGFREGVLTGSAAIKYSRAAIDNALTLLGSKFTTGNGAYVRVRLYNFQEP
jgi:Tfp pilus assembly protein PilX